VLRYVKGTLDFGILYSRSKDPRLCGYTDSDWADSVDDRKSTSGYVFNLGTGAVTWTSKKTACSRPFIDRSRVSRSIERCMRGSLAQEDVIRYADVAERAYTLVL
jgi:hypothetical protein